MPQLGIFQVKEAKQVYIRDDDDTDIEFISFGIGLFIYQSLDAIDGKQARRTQQSGPLGELFDHGK